MSGFHWAFATGVACQQGTLTLPDTWFRPPLWDLLVIQLLRPDSSNLPCLYSTFHLEYLLVLSRFCFWGRVDKVTDFLHSDGVWYDYLWLGVYHCILVLLAFMFSPICFPVVVMLLILSWMSRWWCDNSALSSAKCRSSIISVIVYVIRLFILSIPGGFCHHPVNTQGFKGKKGQHTPLFHICSESNLMCQAGCTYYSCCEVYIHYLNVGDNFIRYIIVPQDFHKIEWWALSLCPKSPSARGLVASLPVRLLFKSI